MAPSPQLAPPGSSTYSSNTMSVGDGTWDSQRNSFLLPNLVGLNFDTMRYNGMGNRFAGLPEYHTLILGHGILAVITFLILVPTAIMIARFHRRRPFWALRLHIWLQILTLALVTVIFILGFIAVGPDRALTNPHHGIGLAIYVLILTQAIGGWWIHGREKGKSRRRIPVKLVLHQWLGRIIALLGIIQIALGLTLYGSPVALFVLYTLAVFILVVVYFVLSYRDSAYDRYDGRGSVYSETTGYESRRTDRRSRLDGPLGALAGAGAAGAGLAALNRLRNRSRSRSRSRVGSRRTSRVDVAPRPSSGSFIEEEKYHRRDNEGGSWRDRLLKIGAVGATAALAKSFFDRRRDRETGGGRLSNSAGVGRRDSYSEDSYIREEAGVGPSPGRAHRPQSLHRRSGSYSSISSRTDINGYRRHDGHNVRDGVATVGALGLLRAAFKGRRERKEQRRVDELRERERENERLARQGSQGHRYTGDGFPRRSGRRGSLTSTDYTSSVADGHAHGHFRRGDRPPLPAGVIPGAAAGAAAASRAGTHPTASGVDMPLEAGGPIPMPAAPADPQGILHQDSSGSEAYISGGGRNHRRHHGAAEAAAVGAAAGVGAAELASERHRRERATASPPMAVKVKLHNDNNRHVTLRRLSEQERVAEQEARRRERSRGNKLHRRRDTDSDLSGNESNDRYRRNARPSESTAGPAYAAPPSGDQAPGYLPPPPPIPGTAPPAPGSVGSPGTYDGTVTDVSTDAASRRRRRRAERAQQGSTQRPAGTVDYT